MKSNDYCHRLTHKQRSIDILRKNPHTKITTNVKTLHVLNIPDFGFCFLGSEKMGNPMNQQSWINILSFPLPSLGVSLKHTHTHRYTHVHTNTRAHTVVCYTHAASPQVQVHQHKHERNHILLSKQPIYAGYQLLFSSHVFYSPTFLVKHLKGMSIFRK